MPPLKDEVARLPPAALAEAERMARQDGKLSAALAHPLERRRILTLLASGAIAGPLGRCDPGAADRHLYSAAEAPEGIVPGRTERFATAHLLEGHARGIVVTHRMGRPLKVEGNPGHPASLGGTDPFAQAALFDLYDPDRASGPLQGGEPVAPARVATMFAALRADLAASRGRGFRILTEPLTSPSLGRMLDTVLARWPEARWHQHAPLPRSAAFAGAMAAYGKPLSVLPNPAAADVILGLDSDLLDAWPWQLPAARGFASRRNPVRAPMSRVYAIEPTPSLLGLQADHRFAVGSVELHRIAGLLAAGLLQGAVPADGPPWLVPLLSDLKDHHGRALVHVGPHQPAALHALCHAMNAALGAPGNTLTLCAPALHHPVDPGTDLRDLVEDMAAGKVETLLVLGGNPCFIAPDFLAALGRVRRAIAACDAPNETALACGWYVPLAHAMEAWSDARALDGTAGICQPQLRPLYAGQNPLSVLGQCLEAVPDSRAWLRATWRDRLPDDRAWQAALAAGVIAGTTFPTLAATLRPAAASTGMAGTGMAGTGTAGASPGLDVSFRADARLGDGQYANNPWLQELPDPLTKTAWDNPLRLPPRLAGRLHARDGDLVTLGIGDRRVTLPCWIVPGQAEGCVVATLGQGRRTGSTARGVGTDLYPLRLARGAVDIRRVGGRREVACTMGQAEMTAEAGDILRRIDLSDFQAGARPDHVGGDGSLYHRAPPGPAAWAMSIDLNACIGCNACVTACQVENNIPVVGREEVLRGRVMHWIRIDRYETGSFSAFQPVLCMQCEQAPCETVCPVGATVHDAEGLNGMVYNRCVGTRFCSNNCPYKVRRFNYFAFAAEERRPPASRNPDVTVRGRGVMEKCSFCLQRIAAARVAHDRDGVPEHAETACQAACPTRAISFGDLNDAQAEVRARKRSPLDYALLPEQNTRPRVTYEARVSNRNPAAGT
ncbi:4Fe-4S dicluster domain-containing protein [Rhodopila sp.]|uniref:4Fe-4S dicluster domain-containing protein n=1 Tax=Rhodopila sp. TaxID=2480087 RepID=UPI002C6EEC24|nr:4Fe-4S dicluster domain-containing protein [Rhodopila sp.]HVZ10291.1 4Fe-4S dicluster domain-containing protein [Rhodopila sp.]